MLPVRTEAGSSRGMCACIQIISIHCVEGETRLEACNVVDKGWREPLVLVAGFALSNPHEERKMQGRRVGRLQAELQIQSTCTNMVLINVQPYRVAV